MKRIEKYILFFNIILLIFSLICIFVINIKNKLFIALILGIITILFLYFVGHEKSNLRFKSDSIVIMFVFSLLLQIMLYVMGLFTGFLKNGYGLSLKLIFKNTFSLIVVVVIFEFLRFILLRKCKSNKKMIALCTITFILLEIIIRMTDYDLTDKSIFINFIFLVLLPCVTTNILYSFNSYRYGFESVLAYRFIYDLSKYIMPLIPDINEYLLANINFIFPLFVMFIIGKLLPYSDYDDEEYTIINYKYKKIISYFVIFLIVIYIGLCSGLFKYYFLVVASGSMQPKIDIGDVLLVKKLDVNEYDELNLGDTLIFKYNDTVIAHKIVLIDGEGQNIKIVTKGENNDEEDRWIITKNEIIGKAVNQIKYIGYPSVMLYRFLNEEG